VERGYGAESVPGEVASILPSRDKGVGKQFLAAAGGFSAELIKNCENLLRPRADAQILGQVHPADRSGRIDQKFSGARNLASVRAAFVVEQVKAANGVKLFVGEERVGVALLPAVLPRNFRRVHANGHDLHSARLELIELFFETPQLGVAEGSPIAAVENQQHPLVRAAGRRSDDRCSPEA